jgi:hypothetical protein
MHMKKNLFISVLIAFLFSTVACTTMPVANNVVESPGFRETLFVYEDGRMEFNSRYVDSKDVVIYADGRGGERAAIKVRVPIHSDFYRDSILVVRVVNKFEEAIGQHESNDVDNINYRM